MMLVWGDGGDIRDCTPGNRELVSKLQWCAFVVFVRTFSTGEMWAIMAAGRVSKREGVFHLKLCISKSGALIKYIQTLFAVERSHGVLIEKDLMRSPD